jgi:hypothetical protein
MRIGVVGVVFIGSLFSPYCPAQQAKIDRASPPLVISWQKTT